MDPTGKDFHNIKNMLPSEKVAGRVKRKVVIISYCVSALDLLEID